MAKEAAKEICRPLEISDDKLKQIVGNMTASLKKGLNKATHKSSVVKCYITYVQDLPTGAENGKFMALDLGGSNLRILLLHLNGTAEFKIDSKVFDIPAPIMVGEGSKLFDFIAECLSTFAKKYKVESDNLPLGFTFPFPLAQEGLTKCKLVNWSKGFNCSGVVGKDVVMMLKEAINRRGDTQISILAVLNDTTGTLISCAWKNRNCRIGLIIGAETNACYLESVDEAQMFANPPGAKKHVVINCEWGAFGDDGLLDNVRTEFDKELDKNSINKNTWRFKKMICSMYLGELVRLVMVKLIDQGRLFNNQNTGLVRERDNFESDYISRIENDPPGSHKGCRSVLATLGLNVVSNDECDAVRYICETVTTRSAKLVSAGLAALINKVNDKKVTVGIDGNLYRFHPKYRDRVTTYVKQLIEPNIHLELMLSEDGSGRGAALVAAAIAGWLPRSCLKLTTKTSSKSVSIKLNK